jgi:acetoin utilization protein AcuB
MTPFPHFVDVDESLLRARVLMVEHDVRHLPVQDRGTLVGILTDRDLKRALDPDLGLPPKEELFVNDVLEPEPYVVDGSEPLDTVLDYMVTHDIGSTLVTKDRKLAGILTTTDACRLLCEHLRSLRPRDTGDSVA